MVCTIQIRDNLALLDLQNWYSLRKGVKLISGQCQWTSHGGNYAVFLPRKCPVPHIIRLKTLRSTGDSRQSRSIQFHSQWSRSCPQSSCCRQSRRCPSRRRDRKDIPTKVLDVLITTSTFTNNVGRWRRIIIHFKRRCCMYLPNTFLSPSQQLP